MKTQKANLGPIVLSALVTGAITLVNTWLIDYCTSQKQHLSYCSHVSEPIEKDSVQLSIYHMELLNDGDDMLEDIKGVIQFNGQHIMAFKLKGSPTLNLQDSLAASSYNLKLAALNPMEKIALAFLVAGSPPGGKPPLVDFRAKGLSAINGPTTGWRLRHLPMQLLVAVITAVILTSLLTTYLPAMGRYPFMNPKKWRRYEHQG